ncbi:sulfite exporter TauE/SafE family protein [Rhizobium grahamii]|uniref:Probable membrane transporter protein n=2 Tax=Rhizobium TaxID=379 RepID=A0A5Q0CDC7_9HYPH|nr:sulfite exporter TauE/SafE family protein [Rhizobium grahamii]QFY61927.1 sulfite exporter TauE/SafE family protein [Rhizobium grahamii]QRM48897.1 sulfite exporter TauE/SafE family protein [Rhizobium sp. BG6]
MAMIVLGAVVAGFVQGLSGFAFGLVAMSFWAWTIEPQLAAVLVVFGALTGQVTGMISVRRGFNLKVFLPFLLGGMAGIPIGVALLPSLETHLFKTILGVLLIIWCPVMLFARQIPPIRVGGKIADSAVGVIGGIMAGIGGFSGPIPTLWCTLRQMEKDEQRAVIQNFNLAALAFTMATYLSMGMVTAKMLPMFAIVAAAMLLPTILGARFYLRISEATFRKIVLGLLTVSGAGMIASEMPSFLSGHAAARIVDSQR